MMKRLLILYLLSVLALTGFAQNERKFVRKGNELFMEAVRDTTTLDTAKFSDAETEYRKALNKKPGDIKWDYNLANSVYKQMRFEEAEAKFSELSEKMEEPEEQARSLHNLGNSQLMQQKIDESIESYKEALRKNPNDMETKYNLAYAQMLKKQQEQQQQQQQQNQDQNNEQEQQQQNQDQQQNNDQQEQQQQDQQAQQDQNQDQQQQQQPPPKISQQDAEQLLQALQNDEREIQERVKKEQAARARQTRVEKEW